MNSGSSGSLDQILSLAVKRGILSSRDQKRIVREAKRRQVDPTDLAMEQGLLDPTQVEALRALACPDQFIAGYEILDLIGAGAVGVVYRARQHRLDRIVALKTINLRRFNNTGVAGRSQLEAKLVASLSHPNIVTAYDYGLHDGRVYLAMELLDGETLQSRIERQGPMEEHLSWAIARQIAAGLEHAAQRDVVHRDIKPANIILTKPLPGMETPPEVPLVKITDFGLAMQLNNLELTRLTASGALIGTPSYTAPEQMAESNVDIRADIFALGATVYHMLTGDQPYAKATSLSAIFVAKQAGNEAWRDQLPDHLTPASVELLHAMTIHNRSERLGDYGLVIERIDAILKSGSGPRPDTIRKSKIASVDRTPLSATVDLPGPRKTPRSETMGTPTRTIQQRRWIWAATPMLVAIIAIVALFITVHSSLTNLQHPQPTGFEYVPAELKQPLFNGESVPIGEQRGTWQPTKATDGARVLSGKDGWLDLTLPALGSAGPLRYFMLRLGINPLEDAVAELQFGRVAGRTDVDSRYAIELARGILRIGWRSDMDASFEPLDGIKPLKLEQQTDGSPVYQGIRLERQPDGWLVFVNDVAAANIPAGAQQDPPRVLLVVRNGTAHFADLDVSELVKRINRDYP